LALVSADDGPLIAIPEAAPVTALTIELGTHAQAEL
jgi:hypothetical protein